MARHRQPLAAALSAVLALNTFGCARATRTPSLEPATDVTLLRVSLQDAFMAQEIYYSFPENKYAYASHASRLDRYQPRPGITLTIFEGTQQGWSGMVQDHTGYACVMYVGKVSKAPTTPRGTVATKPASSRNQEMMCDAIPTR